jgi:hypothetical protein
LSLTQSIEPSYIKIDTHDTYDFQIDTKMHIYVLHTYIERPNQRCMHVPGLQPSLEHERSSTEKAHDTTVKERDGNFLLNMCLLSYPQVYVDFVYYPFRNG